MMPSLKDITNIESRISQVTSFIEEIRQRQEGGGALFSDELQLQSWNSHLSDLRQQLRHAKEEMAYEVFELRLFSGAMNGSLPLRIFSKLSHHLNASIANAAYFLRYGESPVRGVPHEIEDEIDLRFSGISYGSTRLTLSGDTHPDITGESLLELALEHIFTALTTTDTEVLRQEVASIGIRSIHELSSLLSSLDSSGIGAEMTWPTRLNQVAHWGGSLQEVKETRKRLRPISNIKEEKISVSGVVYELKATGSIKIVPDSEDKPIKISYNNQQQGFVDRLHLNETVTLRVTKSGHRDELSGEDRYKYRLSTSE